MTLFVKSRHRTGRKLDTESCVSASYGSFVSLLHLKTRGCKAPVVQPVLACVFLAGEASREVSSRSLLPLFLLWGKKGHDI